MKPVPEKTNLATFEYRIADYPGVVKQEFERGWLAYDPQHQFDHPPCAGEVYVMHLPGS